MLRALTVPSIEKVYDPDFRMAESTLQAARNRLRSAHRHIDNVKKLVDEYVAQSSLESFLERSDDGKVDLYCARPSPPLPEEIKDVTFDAISNLRAALDNACYALAVADGKSGKNAGFPFGVDEAEVASRRKNKGKSSDIPPRIFDLILEMKPYFGGNDTIWGLNKLCNEGKHQAVSAIPISIPFGGTKHLKAERLVRLALPPRWDAGRNRMVLAEVEADTSIDAEFQVDLLICLGNERFRYESRLDCALLDIAISVERILVKLEILGREMGLLSDVVDP